jgi:hypothetical protein
LGRFLWQVVVFGNYGSKEEMEEAFAATGAFNDKLHADGCARHAASESV